MQAFTCPLCHSSKLTILATPESVAAPGALRNRNFQPLTSDVFRCEVCALTFKDPSTFPSALEEEDRYREHDNRMDDQRYRNFLSRLAKPMIKRLKPKMFGLDYGCGPTPVMSDIFKRDATGMELNCEFYDVFFYRNLEIVQKTNHYDFISCSEVFEHFHHPCEEIERLTKMLKQGGLLGVMTQAPPSDFLNWHYRLDPTHVTFYSRETFEWIAETYRYELEFLDFGVTLLKRV